MGVFAFDAWPRDWQHRLGRALAHHPTEAVRIFICECEAWALLFLCRRVWGIGKTLLLLFSATQFPEIRTVDLGPCLGPPITRENYATDTPTTMNSYRVVPNFYTLWKWKI